MDAVQTSHLIQMGDDTYNELIMVGSSYRQTDFWSHSVGISLNNRLALGYTYESVDQSILFVDNPTHEFVLSYDLFRTGYKYKNASYQEKSKMALALRRKTLTRKTITGSPARLSNYKLNPNKRYNQKKRNRYRGKRVRKNHGLISKRKRRLELAKYFVSIHRKFLFNAYRFYFKDYL